MTALGTLLRTNSRARLLFAAVPIVLDLILALRRVTGGWDDGAITAAFARTWASTGHIALTPTSVTVEGFSTVTWFLLLSAGAACTHSAAALLVWMKICSALCALACLPLIDTLARRLCGREPAPAVALLVFSWSTTTWYEIQNGMEMLLAAFLLLLLFFCLTKPGLRLRPVYAAVIGSLLLLTRFEAPFQLVLLFLGMLVASLVAGRTRSDHSSPATALAMPSISELLLAAVLLVVVFVATELVRHHLFHLWMPNTVYAKMWHPYTAWTSTRESIAMRAEAGVHALLPLTIVLSAILGGSLVAGAPSRRMLLSGQPHPAVVSLALGCVLLGAVLGPTFGYTGRMIVPMLPFLILYLTWMATQALRAQSALQRLLLPVALLSALAWLQTVHRPDPIITVADAKAAGDAADDIRRALNGDHLVVMLPDVGGSSLYHPDLTIVDSALLANPVLARRGWIHFDQYVRNVDPDVIDTLAVWATEQGAYNTGMLDNYSIVAARGVRLFVRNDLYARLATQFPASVLPVSAVPGCMPPHFEDLRYSFSRGTCLVLNDRDAQRNYL